MKKYFLILPFILFASIANASRDGSGTMSIPYPSFSPNTTISSSQVNSDFSNVVSEITNSIPRDGQAAPTANIPMGGYKITGLANGSASSDAAAFGQISTTLGSGTVTFTNKTFDTAGTGNIFKINGTTISSISGNTSKLGSVSGALVTGNAVVSDGNGNLVDGGVVPGGGGGSGTVNGGTSGHVAYYATSTTAVSSNINLLMSAGGLTIGQAGSVIGTLSLSGNTSGTTTLTPAAVASGTLTLPTATDTLIGKATTDTLTNKTIDTAGTGNAFKVNGTTVTTASDILKTIGATQGQILYYNGTIWTVLGTGTSGQFLKTQGALANPVWANSTSAVILLNTVNASAAASVSFGATYLTSTYNKYLIEYDGVYPAVDGADFQMRFSTNNCSTMLTTNDYYTTGFTTGVAGNGGHALQATYLDLTDATVIGNTANQAAIGTIQISNPSSATYTRFTSDISHSRTGDAQIFSTVGGSYQGATAINCIQIYMDNGNITGNFHLYGLTGN